MLACYIFSDHARSDTTIYNCVFPVQPQELFAILLGLLLLVLSWLVENWRTVIAVAAGLFLLRVLSQISRQLSDLVGLLGSAYVVLGNVRASLDDADERSSSVLKEIRDEVRALSSLDSISNELRQSRSLLSEIRDDVNEIKIEMADADSDDEIIRP